jgi:hypothetical protein
MLHKPHDARQLRGRVEPCERRIQALLTVMDRLVLHKLPREEAKGGPHKQRPSVVVIMRPLVWHTRWYTGLEAG